jgi:hypothetical protein
MRDQLHSLEEYVASGRTFGGTLLLFEADSTRLQAHLATNLEVNPHLNKKILNLLPNNEPVTADSSQGEGSGSEQSVTSGANPQTTSSTMPLVVQP